MNKERFWYLREKQDLSFRLSALVSMVQLSLGWFVLSAVYIVAARGDVAWLGLAVIAVAFLLAVPIALVDLQVILDAVLHAASGRSGYLVSQLRQSMAEESAERSAPGKLYRFYHGAVIVSSWIIPWRPLSKLAFAYLARTREVIACVMKLDASLTAPVAAKASTSVRHIKPSTTQEMVAVTSGASRIAAVVEQSVVTDVLRRRLRLEPVLN